MLEADDDQDQVQPGAVLEPASTKVRRLKLLSERTLVCQQLENKVWHQTARPETLPLPKVLKTTRSMTSERTENE